MTKLRQLKKLPDVFTSDGEGKSQKIHEAILSSIKEESRARAIFKKTNLQQFDDTISVDCESSFKGNF